VLKTLLCIYLTTIVSLGTLGQTLKELWSQQANIDALLMFDNDNAFISIADLPPTMSVHLSIAPDPSWSFVSDFNSTMACSASRNSNILACVVVHWLQPNQTEPVPKPYICVWKSSSNKPLWCYNVTDSELQFDEIGVSPGGKYIAIKMGQAPSPDKTNYTDLILGFEVSLGPNIIYQKEILGVNDNVISFISENLVLYQTYIGKGTNEDSPTYLVDLETKTMLWNGVLSKYLWSKSLCHNHFILYDLDTAVVAEWTGDIIKTDYTTPMESDLVLMLPYFASDCQSFVVGYTSKNMLHSEMHYWLIGAGEQVWSFSFPNSTDDQDAFSDLAISNDNSIIAAGIWGDVNATYPQLYVFHKSSNVPIAHQFPGSVFLVKTIQKDQDTQFLVLSKTGHANEWGYMAISLLQLMK